MRKFRNANTIPQTARFNSLAASKSSRNTAIIIAYDSKRKNSTGLITSAICLATLEIRNADKNKMEWVDWGEIMRELIVAGVFLTRIGEREIGSRWRDYAQIRSQSIYCSFLHFHEFAAVASSNRFSLLPHIRSTQCRRLMKPCELCNIRKGKRLQRTNR